MKRRLRIAGTAIGAMLVPACAGFQPDTSALRPISATPPPPTPVGYRPLPGPAPAMAAKPRLLEKFAEGRTDIGPSSPQRPGPLPNPAPTVQIVPVEHKPVGSPPAATVEAPRLIHPALSGAPVVRPPEPTPDAEGVIRPDWPIIPGTRAAVAPAGPKTGESDVILPPPSELLKAVAAPPVPPPGMIPLAQPDDEPAISVVPPSVAPASPPAPSLPPGVIGSSVHQTHASPAGMTAAEQALSGEPVVSAAVTNILPSSPAGDSVLLRAVHAFQQNRPDEAVELLKAYDPATQQILLSLMPALVRLSEGKLTGMKPEEMDLLLDQLTRVPNMLRPRASLRAENVRLCREVHNFAHVEPFPDRHAFYAGDIVYLYMELANFSCVPDPKGGYAVTLVSSLDLKDPAGAVVWRADPREAADPVSTPPQDYYRNFRLCVPAVPPGTYTLTVKTTDRPTGRTVQKTIELRVAAR